MIIDDLIEVSKDYHSFLEEEDRLSRDGGSYMRQNWYAGQGFGSLVGGLGGLETGAYVGWHTAEPLYQAVEASIPDAGPVLRVAGNSIPMAKLGVYGLLTYEGGRLGIKVGRPSGRYLFGGTAAGIGGIFDSLDVVRDYLHGDA